MLLATKSIFAAMTSGGTTCTANTWHHSSPQVRSNLSAIAAAAARSPDLSLANRRQTLASRAAVAITGFAETRGALTIPAFRSSAPTFAGVAKGLKRARTHLANHQGGP